VGNPIHSFTLSMIMRKNAQRDRTEGKANSRSPATCIIAEAGVNHNGDINVAKDLIEAASASGADYVKFQTFSADKLVDNNASTAEYQKRNSGDKEMTQHELLQKLELTEADHVALIAHCKLHNVKFLSSPFDLSSIQMLNALRVRPIPGRQLPVSLLKQASITTATSTLQRT